MLLALWSTPAYSASLSVQQAAVEQALEPLSDEQKLSQLLIIGFSGTEPTPFLRRWVTERQVGGVALFARNLRHHAQIDALTRGVQALAGEGVLPFVAVDQEGGGVSRLSEKFSRLPSNMALGAIDRELIAYLAGRAVASDLRRFGFNMNLAPVLDVNSNPNNPVINVRSFGEHPARVAALGEAFLRGQQRAGVSSVVKHFPGHGDSEVDSHFALPMIQADWPRLQRVEMPPFRAAIRAGVDGVMTAHIALPRIAHAGTQPATLSKPIITGLLRHALGYDGVVVTDGLEMQGVAQRLGVGQAAVQAVLAGADMPMVLWSDEGCEQVLGALRGALQQGVLTRARLDASVRRILRVKARRGLLMWASEKPLPPPATSAPANAVHERLMQTIAEDALSWVEKDAPAALPSSLDGWVVLAPAGALLTRAQAAGPHAAIAMPVSTTRAQHEALAQAVEKASFGAKGLLFVMDHRSQLPLLTRAVAQAPHAQVRVVLLGSPYLQRELPPVKATLLTYSSLPQAQQAAARALWGERPAPGRPPISLILGAAAAP